MIERTVFFPKIGIEIKYSIGRSASENVEIIRKSEPHHIWFHIDGAPSGHVVAAIPETLNRKNIAQIITQGAVLCKSNSKFSSDKNVAVVYTDISNLELDEDKVGTVRTKNTKIKTI